MTLFDALPPELICQILAYLPLQDLHALRTTSRSWLKFFDANEVILFHHAAIQHGFTQSITSSVEEAASGRGMAYVRGLDSWRELCESTLELHLVWTLNRCNDQASTALRLSAIGHDSEPTR